VTENKGEKLEKTNFTGGSPNQKPETPGFPASKKMASGKKIFREPGLPEA
jgi:hypothetical protein